MAWITGTLSANLTAGTTIASVLDTALLAGAWVKTTTGLVASDGYTYDVYEVAALDTSEGFPWVFAVGVNGTGKSIRFRAFEEWDGGTDLATNSVATRSGFVACDAVGLRSDIANTPRAIDGSNHHSVTWTPSEVLDAYHMQVSEDAVLGTLDTDASLVVGLYERYIAHADHLPLMLGTITGVLLSRAWVAAALGGATSTWDNNEPTINNFKSERYGTASLLHVRETHAPRQNQLWNNTRFDTDAYLLGGQCVMTDTFYAEDSLFARIPFLYSFGYPTTDYKRGDRITIGIYSWTLAHTGVSAETSSAVWIAEQPVP